MDMTYHNRFNDSKIYILQHEDGHFYIGSTTRNLSRRFLGHKLKSKNPEAENRRIYEYILKNGGWDKVKIFVIIQLNLNNLSELLIEENKYISTNINNPLCLNSYSLKTKEIGPDFTITFKENVPVYNKCNDSKIYKIYSNDNFYYYGSTIENIHERYARHKKAV